MAGKKYKAAAAKIDRKRRYPLKEAVALIPEIKISDKSDETVDVAVRLGVNPKHADQMVRGAVVLPHGTGKSKKTTRFWSTAVPICSVVISIPLVTA